MLDQARDAVMQVREDLAHVTKELSETRKTLNMLDQARIADSPQIANGLAQVIRMLSGLDEARILISDQCAIIIIIQGLNNHKAVILHDISANHLWAMNLWDNTLPREEKEAQLRNARCAHFRTLESFFSNFVTKRGQLSVPLERLRPSQDVDESVRAVVDCLLTPPPDNLVDMPDHFATKLTIINRILEKQRHHAEEYMSNWVNNIVTKPGRTHK